MFLWLIGQQNNILKQHEHMPIFAFKIYRNRPFKESFKQGRKIPGVDVLSLVCQGKQGGGYLKADMVPRGSTLAACLLLY